MRMKAIYNMEDFSIFGIPWQLEMSKRLFGEVEKCQSLNMQREGYLIIYKLIEKTLEKRVEGGEAN